MDAHEGEVDLKVNAGDHSRIMKSAMATSELNKRESNRWGSAHKRIIEPSGVGNGAGRR